MSSDVIFFACILANSVSFFPPSVALQNLLPRVEKAKERSAASGHQEEEFTMELVISLLQNALGCRGNCFSTFNQKVTASLGCCGWRWRRTGEGRTEGGGRPRVLADGIYATETAYTSASAARLEVMKASAKPPLRNE